MEEEIKRNRSKSNSESHLLFNKYTLEKGQFPQQMMMGKLVSHM